MVTTNPRVGPSTSSFGSLGPVLASGKDRRGRSRRAGALLLAVIAIMCVRAGPALADSGSSPAISGMNGWSLYGLSPAELDAQLAVMQADGVRLLRVDASWSSIEPTAPGPSGATYDFSGEDAEVAALAAHQIEWLPILDYSAPWAAGASGDWRSPPADDNQFAGFAAAVAARYGAGGTFWAQNPQLPYEPVHTFEVWNEENGNYFWDSGPDPAAYARLYLAARAAIHGVDPGSRVMIGGLTNPEQGMSAWEFLVEMFQTVPSLKGHVDAVGLHPYAADAAGVVQDVIEVRALLDYFGETATPIDVTEFGWQTGDAAQEQRRAMMMSAVAAELENSNCGIGLLAPYDWMDPAYVSGGDWGIADESGVRSAGTAWFTGLTAAAGSGPTNVCPPGPGSTGGGTSPGAGTGTSSTGGAGTSGGPTTGASTSPSTSTSGGTSTGGAPRTSAGTSAPALPTASAARSPITSKSRVPSSSSKRSVRHKSVPRRASSRTRHRRQAKHRRSAPSSGRRARTVTRALAARGLAGELGVRSAR
jgi:hypothetical protein